MARSVSDRRRGLPLTTEGMADVHVRTVGDRQKTAARLLKSSAERFYDAEVDIDWDAPWDPDKHWLPEHRVSLYGTPLWDKLTAEQRIELGKNEIVSILSFGMYAEGFLSAFLLRVVGRGSLSDHSLYALTEIGEEARHSTMFARLINKTGVRPYRLPRGAMTLTKLLQFVPIGPSTYGGTLLIEEILDRGQRETMNDPELQPHLRQLMKIHVLEEARHITYAREELARGMAKANRFSKAFHRGVLAAIANGVFPVLVNPRVYRSVGIHPLRGFIAAYRSPNYAVNMAFLADPMIRYFYEVGMLEGAITTRLWRATRSLPDDIAEAVFATKT